MTGVRIFARSAPVTEDNAFHPCDPDSQTAHSHSAGHEKKKQFTSCHYRQGQNSFCKSISAQLRAFADKNAKQPCTPYMHHYVIEAMMKLGMKNEAVLYLKKYWGGMIELGADTFWEAYIPDEPDFSPYNDRMINSLCHAWSCTPSYFIRKYNL